MMLIRHYMGQAQKLEGFSKHRDNNEENKVRKQSQPTKIYTKCKYSTLN